MCLYLYLLRPVINIKKMIKIYYKFIHAKFNIKLNNLDPLTFFFTKYSNSYFYFRYE